MKKLSSINWVSFKEDNFYLEDIPINVGLNIEEWLKEYCDISVEFENYSQSYPESERIKFNDFPSISIYLEDKIITSIYVYPYQYQSSPYYKGDIFIFNKKLEVPFLSDDIEQYFLDIPIKPKGYFKRFSPRETIDYIISDVLKIEISIGRDPELVSSLSFKSR
ncbi:hypothetical protein [Flavobacterium succinicans]|uniref:Uncharacterized protein n=1 Tax=Flavobacterium succinicans TaxID=29536 RepID=A0A199XT18_9FLAO|nr:hypothetical protein [Flavobacterium succinicans]OAZ04479.1 hypothetical protein FLB_11250 [Flavobacterium succinicans]